MHGPYYSPPSSSALADETLYFSYGSNMHLKQMAARCPDSALFAKGILWGYQWQINNRGGANVIPGQRDDFVEGILFTVSPSDIRTLRVYEGVEKQFYAESEVEVEVEWFLDAAFEGRNLADAAEILVQHGLKLGTKESLPSVSAASYAEAALNTRGPRETLINSHESGRVSPPINLPIAHLGQLCEEKQGTEEAVDPDYIHRNEQELDGTCVMGPGTSSESSSRPRLCSQQEMTLQNSSLSTTHNKGTVTDPENGKVIRKALVYISEKYRLPGQIREEYIGRMKLAMADACTLGVSEEYLKASLYPQIFGK